MARAHRLLARAALGALLALPACALLERGHPPLETAAAVDLERYLGTWYEIARYPNRFQRGCSATTATYTRRSDGSIGVRNECDRDGARDGIDGRAWLAGDDPARLRVRFFWPLFAPYWILAVGAGYEWALVGTPDRDYLWILARTPTLDPATFDAIAALARERGFDPALLARTPQP
jgi:apolipoprotein D and lipocalin family protein